MALRKRGVTFLICFKKRGLPRRGGGVPTLEEIMCFLCSHCSVIASIHNKSVKKQYQFNISDSLNIIEANMYQATDACQKIMLSKSSPRKKIPSKTFLT